MEWNAPGFLYGLADDESARESEGWWESDGAVLEDREAVRLTVEMDEDETEFDREGRR